MHALRTCRRAIYLFLSSAVHLVSRLSQHKRSLQFHLVAFVKSDQSNTAHWKRSKTCSMVSASDVVGICLQGLGIDSQVSVHFDVDGQHCLHQIIKHQQPFSADTYSLMDWNPSLWAYLHDPVVSAGLACTSLLGVLVSLPSFPLFFISHVLLGCAKTLPSYSLS